MVNFIKALKNEMPTPTWFGWYHLMWLAIMIVACILIFIFRKKINKRSVNIILLVAGIVLAVLEAIKQLQKGYTVSDTGLIWHYPPADFPFQFCSTPMYLLILAGLLRKGKIYDALMGYLSSYSLFAGALVMIYPLGVFVDNTFINIHTMIWHSGLFIMGFLILSTRSVDINIKSVLKATIVFAIMLIIAILMNVFAHLIVPEEYFNMFYIGPYYPNNFVVLQDIYQQVPWIIFIFIYTLGFFFASLIVMLIAIGADGIAKRRTKNL